MCYLCIVGIQKVYFASLIVLAGACGDDDCPSVASSCSGNCTPMMASRYDRERECTSADMQVVGCSSSAIGTGDLVCAKREADGAVFFGSSGSLFQGTPGWTNCSSDEDSAVRAVENCPTTP